MQTAVRTERNKETLTSFKGDSKGLMAKNVEQKHKNIGWDDYITPAAVTKKEKRGIKHMLLESENKQKAIHSKRNC